MYGTEASQTLLWPERKYITFPLFERTANEVVAKWLLLIMGESGKWWKKLDQFGKILPFFTADNNR